MSYNVRTASIKQITGLFAKSAIAALVAGAVFSAHATDTAYDSLTGATSHLVTTEAGADAYNYAYQCFVSCKDPVSGGVSETITSLGDYISLAPDTGRSVTGMKIGFVQGVGSAAFDFQVKVSIFSSPTSLQVTQTSGTISLGSVPNYTYTTGVESIVSLSLGPFNLPDTFYYTISVIPSAGSTVPTNFGIALWDYYQDGVSGSIPVGTDVGNNGSVADGSFMTQVWGTVPGSSTLTTDLGAVNQAGLSNGYTPEVLFTTASFVPTVPAVPEPETYAFMLLGLLTIGARRGKGRKV